MPTRNVNGHSKHAAVRLPHDLHLRIQDYAAERQLPFGQAMIELMRIGLGDTPCASDTPVDASWKDAITARLEALEAMSSHTVPHLEHTASRDADMAIAELVQLSGKTKDALAIRRSKGQGPPYRKFGREVRYDRQAAEAWAKEQREGQSYP